MNVNAVNTNAWIPWTHAFICVQFSRHFYAHASILVVIFKKLLCKKVFTKQNVRERNFEHEREHERKVQSNERERSERERMDF
jgi:hypothetical protein